VRVMLLLYTSASDDAAAWKDRGPVRCPWFGRPHAWRLLVSDYLTTTVPVNARDMM
jgi:hypothetical protein